MPKSGRSPLARFAPSSIHACYKQRNNTEGFELNTRSISSVRRVDRFVPHIGGYGGLCM